MHALPVARCLFALGLLLTLVACQPASVPPAGANGGGVSSALDPSADDTRLSGRDVPTPAALAVEPWSLPAPAGAAQPDLIATADGERLLSWIVREPGGHALQFARQRDGRWGEVQTIARGDDWFVNWADTPHLLATDDGALWAHWLRKSAAATYAYDVALVRSADGGRSWSAPVLVNDDGTPTEHGFVSLWPAAADSLGIAWLDGREIGGVGCAPESETSGVAQLVPGTGGAAHGKSALRTVGHQGHGRERPGDVDGPESGNAANDHAAAACAMTLRAARVDAALARHDERRLDARVCDCCQTDAALTARGPLLVYRDRSADEVRDIAATRREPGGWTPARVVHADRWMMPACPVNGPAVAAHGHEVVVAWYTAAPEPATAADSVTGAGAAGHDDDGTRDAATPTATPIPVPTPSVRLARSPDAGDRFSAPRVVDRGEGVQGRVAVALDADAAWLLWVREEGKGQSLHLARFTPDLEEELQRITVARLQGRGRGTGFPQLVLAAGAAHVVWTDVVAGQPRLQGVRIRVAP